MKPRTTAFAAALLALSAHNAPAVTVTELERRMALGEYEAVLQQIDDLPEQSRVDARTRFLEATALAEAGREQRAIAEFSDLVEAYPDIPEFHNNLAALYASRGQLAEAKEALERAIRTNRSYATVYDNLSAVYVEMARESYVRALRVDSEEKPGAKLQLLHAAETLSSARAGSGAASAERPEAPVTAPVEVARTEPVAAKPVVAPEPTRDEAAPEPVSEPSPVEAAAPARERLPAETAAPAQEPLPAEAADPSPEALGAAPDEAPVTARDAFSALQAWAAAWASQDIEGYLGHYASDFQPPRGLGRQAWEKQRRTRLARPETITVELSEPQARPLGTDRVRIDLLQRYRSPTYGDLTRKRFILVKRDGRWLIQAEKSLKIIR